MSEEEGRVFVGGIDFNFTEDDVREMFEKHGQISDVVIPVDKDTDRPRGFAFVTFENAKDADDAITALHDQECGSSARKITVAKARPRNTRGRYDGGRDRRGGGDWNRSGGQRQGGGGYGRGGGYGGGGRYGGGGGGGGYRRGGYGGGGGGYQSYGQSSYY